MPKKVTQNEPPCALTNDPLNVHKNASNETTLVSQLPSISYQENVIVPGQGKTLLSVLNDDICEKLEFPCLSAKWKLGYNIN